MIITRDMLSARCVLFVCLIFLMPHAAHSQTVEKRELGIVRGPGEAGPIKREGRPGYDHPDQFIGIPAKKIADNLEPVIEHPDQFDEVGKN